MPFTPKLKENGREETRNKSDNKHRTNLTPVNAYKYLLLLIVTKATNKNCVKMANTFAILSMRMYVADAAIIELSVAIAFNNGSAKSTIQAESIVYTLNVTSKPVFNRFENSLESVCTFPIKKNKGKIIASFRIS